MQGNRFEMSPGEPIEDHAVPPHFSKQEDSGLEAF